jgi:hypothetical protein
MEIGELELCSNIPHNNPDCQAAATPRVMRCSKPDKSVKIHPHDE